MKKLTLQDIKEHFSYCIDEGLAIGEQEEILLQSLYKKAEKMEEQQREIETLKNLVAKGTERRVEDNKEWFDAQSVLVEKNARLRKHIRKAIAHFNQDEHPEGMAKLMKSLR